MQLLSRDLLGFGFCSQKGRIPTVKSALLRVSVVSPDPGKLPAGSTYMTSSFVEQAGVFLEASSLQSQAQPMFGNVPAFGLSSRDTCSMHVVTALLRRGEEADP